MFLCRPSCAHRSLRALYRPFSKHLYSTLEHDFQSIASKAKPGDLTKLIQNTIKISGAISVADYMRLALTHPLHGYYMQKDVFGVKGDFITSPEISQIFGEMIAAWSLHTIADGSGLKNQKFHLIEIGAGRGTLSADFIRACAQLKNSSAILEDIHLIDPSFELRKIQYESLCKAFGQQGHLEYDEYSRPLRAAFAHNNVFWHNQMCDIEQKGDSVPAILAHELFDALPIHQFQKTKNGWAEIMVDIDTDEPSCFRLVLSRDKTPATQLLEISKLPFMDLYAENDILEYCPDYGILTKQFAEHLSNHKAGFVLIMDYGSHKGHKTSSLRGIKDHQFVDPWSNTGEVDLSTDVNFSHIAHFAQKFNMKAHGPVTQGHFLKSVGIETRLQTLLGHCTNSSDAKNLIRVYQRLVSEKKGNMGNIYKFMALTSPHTQNLFPFTQ